jgi:hypothetical protein
MIIEGTAMMGHPVEAGIPHQSRVAQSLFATCYSGLIRYVEQCVSAEGIFVLHDHGWVATGRNTNYIVTIVKKCGA